MIVLLQIISVVLNTCASGVITTGQYSGLFDEFQLYPRELSTTEVMDLAIP
jgi:hypothetical protein